MINYKLKRKSDNIQTHATNEVPSGWGFFHEGWKTQDQIDKEDLEAEKYGQLKNVKKQNRIILDKEAQEIVCNENDFSNGLPILSRKIIDIEYKKAKGKEGQPNYTPEVQEVYHTEFYYIVPKQEHEEFFCEANYTIETEDTESEEYKLAHYSELRAQEYPSTSDLIVALWESVVENKNESKNALQATRQAIKSKYPKTKSK